VLRDVLLRTAGSGTYGIKQTANQGGQYTGVAPGMAGCTDSSVPGSGGYSQVRHTVAAAVRKFLQRGGFM